ncbi:MAG: hypothetical protein A2Y97_13245 [Nitrospirae bacterium RBG_13_39_12]|nr:MAG: hypothetical protein A2Y97_13245 [Nitrospirae bacterium RBG_13_39_12]
MLKKSNLYNFFIPSIADIFFIIVFLSLSLFGSKRLLFDCDTGYHIRIGDFIVNTLTIPRHDIFSFTSPPLPWMAYEWMSGVIMSLIHTRMGLTGIVLFFAFVIALTFSLFFRIMKSYKADMLISVFLVSLVIGTASIHWLARPHIFSLFLMVIWYYILDLYQYRGKNYLYFLPLLILIWVNLHQGFIIAFILNGIYLLGNFVKFLFTKKNDKVLWINKAKSLSFITIICLLISLVNPYGYRLLILPFTLMSSKFVTYNISEFLSPNFHESMPFTYLLFFMIIIFSLSKVGLDIIELVLIVSFTYMALHSARFIPLFAIISAPIILKYADKMMRESRGKIIDFVRIRSKNIETIDSSSRGHIWPVLTLIIILSISFNGKISYSFDSKIKPVEASKFLNSEKLAGNTFNDAEFGDYIIYSMWPKYKVFICAEIYSEDRLKEYYRVKRIEPEWNAVLDKYNINWIIDKKDSALSTLLLERKDWKIIYVDKVAAIFVRNMPENRYFIEKYSSAPGGED